MSTCSDHAMTNHHHSNVGVLAQITDTLQLWRKRRQMRLELARWSERDLHDVGLSWSDVAFEASKPFWRA